MKMKEKNDEMLIPTLHSHIPNTSQGCLLITTQKEHILDINSHEFHIF